MQTRLIGLVLVLGVAASDAAQAQVFFRMDYSSAAAPSGGWPGTVGSATTHTTTQVNGGGPQGEGAYDMIQRYAPSARYYGGEYDWGWNGNLEGSDPAPGSRRFYRWRMRFSPDTNFRGVYSTDGGSTTLTNKILIIGDGCGDRCRVIVSYRGAEDGRSARYMRVAIDGGEDPADAPAIRVGEWVNVQLEIIASSTMSARDGGYKIWINSNDYNRPTAQTSGILLQPLRWRYVFFGAYNNNGLQSGGVHTYRHTGFEAATSFDGGWHRGSTLPSTPSNLRILPPQ